MGRRLPDPRLIRWPGVIKPGTVINDICAHQDFMPTFAAAAGETDLVGKLQKGSALNGKKFRFPGENCGWLGVRRVT